MKPLGFFTHYFTCLSLSLCFLQPLDAGALDAKTFIKALEGKDSEKDSKSTENLGIQEWDPIVAELLENSADYQSLSYLTLIHILYRSLPTMRESTLISLLKAFPVFLDKVYAGETLRNIRIFKVNSEAILWISQKFPEYFWTDFENGEKALVFDLFDYEEDVILKLLDDMLKSPGNTESRYNKLLSALLIRGYNIRGPLLKKIHDRMLEAKLVGDSNTSREVVPLAIRLNRLDVVQVLLEEEQVHELSPSIFFPSLSKNSNSLELVKAAHRLFPDLFIPPYSELNPLSEASRNRSLEGPKIVEFLNSLEPSALNTMDKLGSKALLNAAVSNFESFEFLAQQRPDILKETLERFPGLIEIALQRAKFRSALLMWKASSQVENLPSIRLAQFSWPDDPKELLAFKELLSLPGLERHLLTRAELSGNIALMDSGYEATPFLFDATLAAIKKEKQRLIDYIKPDTSLHRFLTTLSPTQFHVFMNEAPELFIPSNLTDIDPYEKDQILLGENLALILSKYPQYAEVLNIDLENPKLLQNFPDRKIIDGALNLYRWKPAWEFLQKTPDTLHFAQAHNLHRSAAYYPTPIRNQKMNEQYGLYLTLKNFRELVTKAESDSSLEKTLRKSQFFEILANEGTREEIINDLRWTPMEVLLILEEYLITGAEVSAIQHSPETTKLIERDFSYFTQFLVKLIGAREKHNQEQLRFSSHRGSLYHVLAVQIHKSKGLKLREVTKLRDGLVEKGHFQELLREPLETLPELEEKSLTYLRACHEQFREDLYKRRDNTP